MIRPVSTYHRPDDDQPKGDRLMDMQDTGHKGDSGEPEATVLAAYRIPVSLKHDLKYASFRTGRTMQDIVIEAIRSELGRLM